MAVEQEKLQEVIERGHRGSVICLNLSPSQDNSVMECKATEMWFPGGHPSSCWPDPDLSKVVCSQTIPFRKMHRQGVTLFKEDFGWGNGNLEEEHFYHPRMGLQMDVRLFLLSFNKTKSRHLCRSWKVCRVLLGSGAGREWTPGKASSSSAGCCVDAGFGGSAEVLVGVGESSFSGRRRCTRQNALLSATH